MATIVAGHTFEDRVDAVCGCGRAWVDIAETTLDDVGKPDIAHTGTLNEREAKEIAEERERRRLKVEHIWEAMVGAVSA